MSCQTKAQEKNLSDSNKEIGEEKVIEEEEIKTEVETPSYLTYSWLSEKVERNLINSIQTPKGFERVTVEKESFGEWLRFLPTKTKNSPVYYHNGSLKPQQNLHEAILDIDIGKADLQQCADATMRLRGEYLYSIKQFNKIHFNFTNGDLANYEKWKSGYAIRIANNKLQWYASSKANGTYTSFKKYMKWIFMYAGTASLDKELARKTDLRNITAGDLLIKGGFPGHAVIVLDVCVNPTTKEKLFMVAQSYTPAQSIHVLKNFNQPKFGVWYSVENCLKNNIIQTPQWTFYPNQLKEF
jgi:hypothetical protein